MATAPTAKDYEAFAKSLKGLSSAAQVKAINDAKASLRSQGLQVDSALEAQYINPVLQNTLNANVGLSPTLTGGPTQTLNVADTTGLSTGTGSGVTLNPLMGSQSSNGATLGGGGANINLTQPSGSSVVGTGTGPTSGNTTSLNLAPTSGAPSMSVNQGPSSVTVGSGQSGVTTGLNPPSGPTLGGNVPTVDLTQPTGSSVVGTGPTPGVTVDPSTITPGTGPEVGTDTGTDAIEPLYGRYSPENTARIGLAAEQLTGMAAGTATLPESQKATAAQITEATNEFVDDPTKLGQVTTTTEQVGTPTQVGAPTSFDAETYTASQTGELGSVDFTAGDLSTNALVANIQGQVSEQSLVRAAQGTVSPQATVKFQMEELMQSVEEGEPFPAWAAPAARSIGAIMQKRGLGTSSMASAALMQAVVESGIPIAAQDAQTYAQIDLQNLNNRQQAALQNAATYAAMDRANLDARMQAAVTNAQSFLAIDLQNLTNEQRSRELEYQSNVQRMFTNQASENAALQFNAQSENQVEMFFSELSTQVETANANRSAAAEQFNVSQSNAMEQFTASLNNARDQFNTSMSFQVDQSNAEWRRQINTVNTAADNTTNLTNAQNAFGASQNAIAQLWQEYRDELAWINTSAENAQARAHEITLYALQQANVLEQLDEQVENSVWERIGERIVDRVIPV